MLKNGPVLVVLFGAHAPRARLEQLARFNRDSLRAGLQIRCRRLGPLSRQGATDRRQCRKTFASRSPYFDRPPMAKKPN